MVSELSICSKCKRKQRNLPLWSYELHGLSQFFVSNKYGKSLWATIILSFLGIAVWFTIILTNDFLDNRATTVFEYRQVKKIRYPGITICPKNGDAVHYRNLEIDMRDRISNLTNSDVDELIIFAIAGSGVAGFATRVSLWDHNDIALLSKRIEEWKGERSWSKFFTFIFEENGYKCEELFHRCFYGARSIDCCEIFKPVYVILNGRCFQLQEFYQDQPHDWGRLHLYMHDLPSYFLSANGKQSNLMLYLSDNYPDVARYPKFYLSQGNLNRIMLQMRNISMSEATQHCSNLEESQGRGTCFTNAWLKDQLIEPFNCSVHYLKFKRPELKTCRPGVIISNYDNITKNHVNTRHCRPACQRSIISETLLTGQQKGYSSAKASYSVVVSYTDMQIEHYREDVYLSLAGFISEIGGQVLLFMGISLNSVIQMVLLIAKWIGKGIKYCKLSTVTD